MSVYFFGDLHIGNLKQHGGEMVGGLNQRCRDQLAHLRSVMSQIGVKDHDTIVQVGDFFDAPTPSPAIYKAVMDLVLERLDVRWHILAGNHDKRNLQDPSALAPLSYLPNVTVWEDAGVCVIEQRCYAMLPYISHSAAEALRTADALPRARGSRTHTLVAHYGYEDLGQSVFNTFWEVFLGHEHEDRRIHHTERGRVFMLGNFDNLNYGEVTFQNPVYARRSHPTGFSDHKPTELYMIPTSPFCSQFRHGVPDDIHLWLDRGRIYCLVSPHAVDMAEEHLLYGMIDGYNVTSDVSADPDVATPIDDFVSWQEVLGSTINERVSDLEMAELVWDKSAEAMQNG